MNTLLRCIAVSVVLALSLSACGGDPPAPTASPPAAAAEAARPATAHALGARPDDIARLIAIANEDFAAQRFVSPPTVNALEGFLEVRDLDPDNASVREALVDLYPLATAALGGAVDAHDLAEAERILELVERGMPDALGVAELRADVDRLRQAAATAADGAVADSVAAATITRHDQPGSDDDAATTASAADPAGAAPLPTSSAGENSLPLH